MLTPTTKSYRLKFRHCSWNRGFNFLELFSSNYNSQTNIQGGPLLDLTCIVYFEFAFGSTSLGVTMHSVKTQFNLDLMP